MDGLPFDDAGVRNYVVDIQEAFSPAGYSGSFVGVVSVVMMVANSYIPIIYINY
jgi:hypothetical protein